MKEIVFSLRAKKKLENLLNYLETEWSESVKQDFIVKLDNSLFRISRLPKSNPVSKKEKTSIKAWLANKQACIIK